MVFSSTIFLVCFLPMALLLYYALPRRARAYRNAVLLLFSLVFYAWGEPVYVLLLIASILVNWLTGRIAGDAENKRRARLGVIAACVFNVGMLFGFKYLGFLLRNVNAVFHIGLPVPEIAMPIGISFYTFQALSYVIDVYRGHGAPHKTPFEVGLYVAFFPQLIAGPIVRYETIADQIWGRRENLPDFSAGTVRFIIGLAKKVLIANGLAPLADTCFSGNVSGAGAWIGLAAYTLQIFYDFSGYSDMAIGLGLMFGFHFKENFDRPYLSGSISDFWRRWHISLGSWFRDYVYIPLGGSRVKPMRHMLNLLIVWALTGLWHGANWTFVAWGMMYFVLIAMERITGIARRKSIPLLSWIYTMFFVMMGWVVFRSASLPEAGRYYAALFGRAGGPFVGAETFDMLRDYGVYLFFAIACLFMKGGKMQNATGRGAQLGVAIGVIALFAVSFAVISFSTYNPFIYFNF